MWNATKNSWFLFFSFNPWCIHGFVNAFKLLTVLWSPAWLSSQILLYLLILLLRHFAFLAIKQQLNENMFANFLCRHVCQLLKRNANQHTVDGKGQVCSDCTVYDVPWFLQHFCYWTSSYLGLLLRFNACVELHSSWKPDASTTSVFWTSSESSSCLQCFSVTVDTVFPFFCTLMEKTYRIKLVVKND